MDDPGVRRLRPLAGLSRWWKARSPQSRRRILLGSLVGLSLAARDVLLLAFAGGLLATFELAGEPAPAPRAAV